jgi:hypothetical protein
MRNSNKKKYRSEEFQKFLKISYLRDENEALPIAAVVGQVGDLPECCLYYHLIQEQERKHNRRIRFKNLIDFNRMSTYRLP